MKKIYFFEKNLEKFAYYFSNLFNLRIYRFITTLLTYGPTYQDSSLFSTYSSTNHWAKKMYLFQRKYINSLFFRPFQELSKWPIYIFLICACQCLILSTLFHTFYCKCEKYSFILILFYTNLTVFLLLLKNGLRGDFC